MDQNTQAKIAAWQKTHGIQPADGERAEKLREMSRLAFELIRLIELEISGIRDVDGSWHRYDPLCDTLELLEDCYPEFEEHRESLRQLAFLEQEALRARGFIADFANRSIHHSLSPEAKEKARAEGDKVMDDDSVYDTWQEVERIARRPGGGSTIEKERLPNVRVVLR